MKVSIMISNTTSTLYHESRLVDAYKEITIIPDSRIEFVRSVSKG